MEQILQKNKKTFPVWNIIKKIKMVYNFRNVDEKQHSLIRIENKKTFPVWNIIKKIKMVYNSETMMRNIL